MMIEKIVLDYLNSKFGGICYMERPPVMPEGDYILIEKTGGSRRDYIDSAVIAIQSYSSTLYKAAQLNERVKNAMFDITELDSVSRCALNSDYNFTKSNTKEYRYQSVYDIVYYR